MFKILFTGNTFSTDEIKELRKKNIAIISERIDLKELELIDKLQNIQGYILGGEEIATQKVLQNSPDLKFIAFYGAGYEKYIDLKTAQEKGIIVTNTPKANAYTTAEHTVSLLLDAVKKVTNSNNLTKRGHWIKRSAWDLKGKTLGILGLGSVGQEVARIMKNGFGMKILYISRTSKPDLEKELSAWKMDLPNLLPLCDVLSVHLSYSEETIGILGEREFKLMKPSAVLVNTARAEIVDPRALYQSLKSNQVGIAAFDVYYQEPVPIPSKDKWGLLHLSDDKFLITPHTAYNSPETIQKMNQMVLESLFSYLDNHKVRHQVD